MSRLWLLPLLIGAPCLAVWEDHCPIPASILKQRRFPQKSLGECGLTRDGGERKLAFGRRSLTFRQVDQAVELSGQNLSGRPWRVRVASLPFCRAISADYDRNGQPDVTLIYSTLGNGMAPNSHVLFLMFDRTGDPVPWLTWGWVHVDDDGTSEDILDLNGDGRAEFLFMWWGGGYWSTTPYEARDSHWHRVTGRFAGSEFPIWTRFTGAPNRAPVGLPREKWPERRDLSNQLPEDVVTVRSIEASKERVVVRFSDGFVGKALPYVTVLERASGRIVYVGGIRHPPEVLEFFREAARLEIPVRLLAETGGIVNYLWSVWR